MSYCPTNRRTGQNKITTEQNKTKQDRKEQEQGTTGQNRTCQNCVRMDHDWSEQKRTSRIFSRLHNIILYYTSTILVLQLVTV